MARYLVERYLPASDAFSLADEAACLRGSRGAKLLMTFYAAEDETCFHLLEAGSATAVRRAGEGAGVRIDRVVRVETVDDGWTRVAPGQPAPREPA
ncbi:MAG: hypothetical protein ACRDSS_09865 [Actinocrinis sp.]